MTPEQLEWTKRPVIGPPKLQQVEGTRYWKLCEDYNVSLPPPYWPNRMVIPSGWLYDRSSIPKWIPQWIINKDDLGTLAPAVHDAGYQEKGVFAYHGDGIVRPFITTDLGDACEGLVRRSTVDEWFYLFMLRQRINKNRAKMAYRAVTTHWSAMEFLGLTKQW